MDQTNWGVTVQDVLDLTGVTVTSDKISFAGGVVDSYSNRTQAASGSMTPRDFGWIQRAVAYQAAWIVNQIDIFGRNLTAELDQDSMKTKTHGAAGDWREWAQTLGPLAARTLKNLSWKGRRTDQMGHRLPRRPLTAANDPNFLQEDGLW